MKKLLLYLFFMGTFVMQASPNNHEPQKRTTTMRTFDSSPYKNFPTDKSGRYKMNDIVSIRLIISGKAIQVEEKSNGAYADIYIYNKDGNKILRTIGTTFYDLEIGLWMYYDQEGNFYTEENRDEGYLLSVDDLVKKMKEEHKEDLLNPDKVYSVARSYKLNPLKKPVYIVDCWQKGRIDRHYGDDFLINSYLIDATTGETIFTNVWLFYNEAAYGAFSAYLIHLGLESESDYAPKPHPNLPPPTLQE